MSAYPLEGWFRGLRAVYPSLTSAAEARDARHLALFSAALDRQDWSEAALIWAGTRIHLDCLAKLRLEGHVVFTLTPVGHGARVYHWPLQWDGCRPLPWAGCPDGMLALLLAVFGEPGEMLDEILPAALEYLPEDYRRLGEPYSEEAREEMLLAMRDTWGE